MHPGRVTLYCTWRPSALTTLPRGQIKLNTAHCVPNIIEIGQHNSHMDKGTFKTTLYTHFLEE